MFDLSQYSPVGLLTVPFKSWVMSSKLKQKKSKLNSAMFWADALHEFVLNPEILIITERNISIHLDFSNLEFGKMIKKNWLRTTKLNS